MLSRDIFGLHALTVGMSDGCERQISNIIIEVGDVVNVQGGSLVWKVTPHGGVGEYP